MQDRRNIGAAASKGMKINKQTAKRLLKYITSKYKKQLIFVVICIILSSVANVAGSLFLKTLIDDYISPLLLVENPVFNGFGEYIFPLNRYSSYSNMKISNINSLLPYHSHINTCISTIIRLSLATPRVQYTHIVYGKM